jgi:8-oxo-dGTP diphosphatase
MTFTYKYPRPSLTVDCVVFGMDFTPQYADLQVLLIERGVEDEAGDPSEKAFVGSWALPGGFVDVNDDDQGEDLEVAAHRELREEAGIEVDYLEQLFTFGKPGRDPRGRVVSVAYYALVRSKDHVATAGSDAKNAKWFSIVRRSLVSETGAKLAFDKLAFDHGDVLDMAVKRLQGKVRYAPVGFNLLPPKFTIMELQEVYESILMRTLDRANFRRRVVRDLVEKEILVKVGQQQNVSHRPGDIYRFDKKAYDRAVRDGVNFEL